MNDLAAGFGDEPRFLVVYSQSCLHDFFDFSEKYSNHLILLVYQLLIESRTNGL